MDQKETADESTTNATAGEASPQTVRYFWGDGVLLRRQSKQHYPEIYREGTKTWDPYQGGLFKFDHTADAISEAEAKEYMETGR